MSLIHPYIKSKNLNELFIVFRKYIEVESVKQTNTDPITFKQSKHSYEYIINNKSYPLRWNSLKKLSSDNQTHLFLLIKFGEFRKLIIDSLLFSAVKETKKCKTTPEHYNVCQAIALGSNTFTSDYDINLLSDTFDINKSIIHTFYNSFKSIFHDTPAQTFDTNIYGISFLDKKHNVMNSDIDRKQQLIWSFAKLRFIELKFERTLYLRFENMTPQFSLLYTEASSMLENLEITKDIAQEKTPDINHALYLNQLDMIDKLLKGRSLSSVHSLDSANQDLIKQIKHNISIANVYANETYFSQGAFIHVVGEIQSNLKLDISSTDYINSFLENFFDLNKEYVIYKNSNSSSIFLRNSYKYLFRCFDAASKIHKKIKINAKLVKLFQKLDTARRKQNNEDKILQLENSLNNLLKLSPPIQQKTVIPSRSSRASRASRSYDQSNIKPSKSLEFKNHRVSSSFRPGFLDITTFSSSSSIESIVAINDISVDTYMDAFYIEFNYIFTQLIMLNLI